MDRYSVGSIGRSGVHSRRILPVVVSVGSTLLALAALLRVDVPSRSVGRVRPLRERFRADFEQAARGESIREDGIGDRDAVDACFFQHRAYPAATIPSDALGRRVS